MAHTKLFVFLVFQYDRDLGDTPDVRGSRMFCIHEHDPDNCSMRVQQVKEQLSWRSEMDVWFQLHNLWFYKCP